jgi:hypothetical protein
VRRIIGDLSDRERVLIGLDLLYEELSEETFDLPGQQSVEFAESSESSESVSEGSEPAAGP